VVWCCAVEIHCTSQTYQSAVVATLLTNRNNNFADTTEKGLKLGQSVRTCTITPVPTQH
jgi:hypothetical protein